MSTSITFNYINIQVYKSVFILRTLIVTMSTTRYKELAVQLASTYKMLTTLVESFNVTSYSDRESSVVPRKT